MLEAMCGRGLGLAVGGHGQRGLVGVWLWEAVRGRGLVGVSMLEPVGGRGLGLAVGGHGLKGAGRG